MSETRWEADILIVDDNPNNLKVLSSTLKSAGFKVRAAINGVTAILAVESQPPDLILLDINLPDIDGYDILKKLKKNPLFSNIPVIFVSAFTDVQAKVKAFEYGGTDYISKPFQVKEVLARVRTHLNLYRQQQRIVELSHAERQARLRAESAERHYSAILNATRDIIYVTDAIGAIVFANVAWVETLGYEIDSLATIVDVIDENYLPMYNDCIDSVFRSKKQQDRLDLVFRDIDGQPIAVSCVVELYSHEDEQFVRVIAYDRSIEIEREMQQIAGIRAAIQQDVLSDTTRQLSNNLRSPLSIIKIQVHLLERLVETSPQNGAISNYLRQIDFQLDRIGDYVNQFSDYYRFFTVHDVELESVNIDDIFSWLSLYAREKDVSVAWNVQYGIVGDSLSATSNDEMLKIALANIIHNAVIYSYPERVEVDAYCIDNKTIIEIKDSGIGISKAELDIIYDAFRVSDIESEESRIGLGLTIAKRIVELINGKMTIESQVDSGTIVTIELPLG